MTKCCSTCAYLNELNICNSIEDSMLVMVRVVDKDLNDKTSEVDPQHAIIVKDKALNTFYCNKYKPQEEKKK